MTQNPQRSTRFSWVPVIIVVVAIIVAGIVFGPQAADRLAGEPEYETGTVEMITNVITVEASGVVVPLQTAQLYWKTTGQVSDVYVAVGDQVRADDILMVVDPTTVPTNLVNAEADLIAAQDALDDLLNPDSMTVANAQKELTSAYATLSQAEQALNLAIDAARNAGDNDLYQDVVDARDTLGAARSEFPLANANLELQGLYSTMRLTDRAYQIYQDLDDEYEDSESDPALRDSVEAARESYEAAREIETDFKDTIDSDDVDLVEAIADAQQDYDNAVEAFIDSLEGDDIYDLSVNLAEARANLVITEELLFDAITRMENVRFGPDEDALRAAESRVKAAQSAVDMLSLTAPFDGEIIAVEYKPGDVIGQGQVAVIVADLSELHVTVMIDETEIEQVNLGDPVIVSFNAQPDLEVEGEVLKIGRMGQNFQGLVKYEVEIVLESIDQNIILGGSADASIEVDVEENVLAVPLDALQSDSQGEFVNRVMSDGSLERVPVVSGSLQGSLVVVTGNLSDGDRVQIVEPELQDQFSGPF